MGVPAVRLGFERNDRAFLYVVGALVGLGLGVATPYLAGWVADWPWVPFSGPLQLIGSFDSPWATWGRPALGLVLGLAFALYIIHDSPVVAVSDERIEVTKRGTTRRIARADVAGIYRDGGKVIVEGHQGRRLFHGEIEGGKDRVRDVFISFGYPWEST